MLQTSVLQNSSKLDVSDIIVLTSVNRHYFSYMIIQCTTPSITQQGLTLYLRKEANDPRSTLYSQAYTCMVQDDNLVSNNTYGLPISLKRY